MKTRDRAYGCLCGLAVTLLGVGCAPSIEDEELGVQSPRVYGEHFIMDEPEVVAGDSYWGSVTGAPQLVSDGKTFQSIVFGTGDAEAIRVAMRPAEQTAGGVRLWGPWQLSTLFSDYATAEFPDRYETPFMSYFTVGEDQQFPWLSFSRRNGDNLQSRGRLILARQVYPLPNGNHLEPANCGIGLHYRCYEISAHPDCHPLGVGVTSDGPEGHTAPFVLSPDASDINSYVPQSVSITWRTHGVLVAALLNPATGNVSCWTLGDDDDDGGEAGAKFSADSFALVPASPIYYEPAPAGRLFASRYGYTQLGGSPVDQFHGSGGAWATPDDYSAPLQQPATSIGGYVQAKLPPELAISQPSDEMAILVSSHEPFPWTSDCPESAREYAYTTDAGQTWSTTSIPSLDGNPGVCHATLALGQLPETTVPSTHVFFYNGDSLAVTFGLRDGSQWHDSVYQVDAIGGRYPSAVTEEIAPTPWNPDPSHHIYTVAHLDPNEGQLRVVRGMFY